MTSSSAGSRCATARFGSDLAAALKEDGGVFFIIILFLMKDLAYMYDSHWGQNFPSIASMLASLIYVCVCTRSANKVDDHYINKHVKLINMKIKI